MTQDDVKDEKATPAAVEVSLNSVEDTDNEPKPSREILAAPEDDIPQEELNDKPARAVEPVDNGNASVGGEEEGENTQSSHNKENEEVALVCDEDMQILWKRTGSVQKDVVEWVTKQAMAEKLLEMIQQAREGLQAGKRNYEEAANLVSQVEFHISAVKRVRRDSQKVAPLLFAYEIFMLILVAVGMFFFLTPVLAIQTTIGTATVNINQFLNSVLWGSLGGIVGALYALWKHTASDQDFDAHYSLWYITNPILGLALGAFTFLLIQAGFFSLTAGSDENGVIRSAYAIYLFAWVVGFKQNVVYEIVRRVLDVFAIHKEEEPTETTSDTSK